MTLSLSPWAVDGAAISSSLARLASYASVGGAEGIVSAGDLQVLPLTVAGVGVRITAGAGVVLNRYQSKPNEVYVFSNPTEHVIPSSEMPAASASERYFLLAITIGDPQFSQTGHPWMKSTDPAAGTEDTFAYVRPALIPCSANTTRFAQLGLSYPGLELARIRIPANETTIHAEYITPLQRVARPRVETHQGHQPFGGTNALDAVSTYERWPQAAVLTVDIPDWATKCRVDGFIEGTRLTKQGSGQIRVTIDGVGSTATTNVNESAPTSGSDRTGYNLGGIINIPAAARGTTRNVYVEASANNDTSAGFLTTDGNTTVLVNLRLEEGAA